MRSYLPQQEESIKRETNRFIEDVKTIISGGSPIKPRLDTFIPKIFNFRMLALKWIGQQQNIDFDHLLDDAYPSLEALRNNPKLTLLAENALFAVRCNARVMKAIVGSVKPEELSQQLIDAPFTTYEQFFGTLALSIPDQEAFQTIADFLNTTLYIEFILLAAILIDDEHIKISEAGINELAFLIADAAQEHIAVATMMGILPMRKRSSTIAGAPIYSDEDQLLSNFGLSDFAKNF